jgi:DNA-binding NarL/FixJ family response regulator
MPAHLVVFQHPRNPTEHDRAILELIAAGHSHTSAAAELHTRPRNITQALAKMRARYTAATNEALIAIAVRLQWIALAIDCEVIPALDTTSPDT